MKLDPQLAEDFEEDGAVLIKGLFRDWVDTIRAGIERNMAKPGPYAAENLKPGESGRFFDDYCNWDRIPEFVESRRRNFTRLYKGLEQYQDELILPTLDPRSNPSWFALPITVRKGLSRRALVQWLEKAKIETREMFGGNILKQPGYQNIRCRISGSLEQTDRVMRDTFFIGVYPGLTDEMIEFVLESFAEFFSKRSNRSSGSHCE